MILIEHILVVLSICYVLFRIPLFNWLNIIMLNIPIINLVWACRSCLAFWVSLILTILTGHIPLHLFPIDWLNIIFAGFICYLGGSFLK